MSKNKVALITGANKGIGLEIARQLGRLGFTVLLGTRDERRGGEATDQLRGEGIDARAVRLDVTDQGTIDAAASTVEASSAGLMFSSTTPPCSWTSAAQPAGHGHPAPDVRD